MTLRSIETLRAPSMTLRTQHELLAAAVNRSEALLSARYSANGDARRLASDEDLVEATESDTLTERHARSVAGPSRQLLLTFVNKVRLDFATTWAAHVRRLGLANWLVGATDGRALRSLRRAGVPCFGMRTQLPEGEWAWGSQTFKALGQHKIELIYRTLQWGLELVITDVDALVLRDPFAYVARWPDAGFLSTSDHLANTTSDGGLESAAATGAAINIGYMFFRPSALPLVEEWRRRMLGERRSASVTSKYSVGYPTNGEAPSWKR